MINGLINLKNSCTTALNRLELYGKLVAVEAKIESALLVRRLIWAGIGIVFAFFSLAIVHTAILGHFWHSDHRLVIMAAILLADATLASLAFYAASKPAKREAFAVTKHQLAEDIQFVKDSL